MTPVRSDARFCFFVAEKIFLSTTKNFFEGIYCVCFGHKTQQIDCYALFHAVFHKIGLK